MTIDDRASYNTERARAFPLRVWKNQFVTNTLVGVDRGLSTWIADPNPGVRPTAAAFVDRSTPGAYSPNVGNYDCHIADVRGSAADPCTIIVYDRLCACGGLAGDSAALQTVNVTIPTNRGATVDNVEWFLEVYDILGATAATLTITYTNHLDQAGQTTTIAMGTATRRAIVLTRIVPNAGHRIKSIQSVQFLAGTAGLAGNFGVTVARRLANVQAPGAGAPFKYDAHAMGLTVVPRDAALWFVVRAPDLLNPPTFGITIDCARAAATQPTEWLHVDFSVLNVGASALPDGMVLTSGPSTARTVQTSESTVVVGVAQGLGRIGKLAAAHANALVLEEARTNRWTDPRAIPAIGGVIAAGNGESPAPSLSGLAGPDGAGDAPRYQVLSGFYSRNLSQNGQPSAEVTCTQWERSPSGTTSAQATSYNANVDASGGDVTAQWARRKIRNGPAGAARSFVLADGRDMIVNGGIAAGARDAVIDLVTIADGVLDTEAIQTGGATRAAESLRLPYPLARYLVDDRLIFAVRFRPKGARGDYANGSCIWYIDANNNASFDTNGDVKVTVAGVTYTFSGILTWNAGDTVDLFIAVGGAEVTRVKYRRNGGGVASFASTAPQPKIGGGLVYVMCDPAGAVTSSRIETIDVSETPEWAA